MMTVADLTSRVTRRCLFALPGLVAGAGWLAGPAGAVGVGAGAGIALVHFRWLVRGAAGAVRPGARGAGAFSAAGLGVRYVVTFVALALTLASGWAHPLAVLAGLSVLPPVLIAEGVRSVG
jgi:ATP synthase I subunit